MPQVMAPNLGHHAGPWRAVLAGACASLVGIGLARFAYTPLIPVLIAEGWFAPAEVAYLGAANLAGYLAGALLARIIARRTAAAVPMRAMMLLASATFFASALPLSFAWYFLWRLASGFAGGVLMVVAAPVVLAAVPPFRRGLAGGAIFTGVGLGIALSGTLVPLLLRMGLVATWCGLGALALLLTLVAWRGWPPQPGAARAPPTSDPHDRAPRADRALRALYLEYGLCAVGLVPHMVFLVDFVARGLGRGLDAGAGYWVLFGLAACVGPLLAGRLADQVGFGPALRLVLLIQAAAVAWPALAQGALGLAVSSIVIGAAVPGVVPLVLGRVQELAGAGAQGRTTAWSTATTAFALGQAGAAYGFSFIFAQTGSHPTLFALGAAALALALVLDLATAWGARSGIVPAHPTLRSRIGRHPRR
jgi:predicted MFS family arabinose efflux permease